MDGNRSPISTIYKTKLGGTFFLATNRNFHSTTCDYEPFSNSHKNICFKFVYTREFCELFKANNRRKRGKLRIFFISLKLSNLNLLLVVRICSSIIYGAYFYSKHNKIKALISAECLDTRSRIRLTFIFDCSTDEHYHHTFWLN